jgi:O-antigen ligase
LTLLFLCFFGIYEYVFYYRHSGGIHLFSGNPLPAGALLILLSAGPLILLKQKYSPTQKTTLTICLLLSTLLVLLIAKKGPLLGLAIILLLLVFLFNRSFLRFIVFFIFLAVVMLLFSDTLRSKYKTNFYNESSISLRAESYFFGFHVFKNNPFFGIGLKTDLVQHLEYYDIRLADKISKDQYHEFVQSQKTFENIIMAFLVELGGLFTITYFGGLAYILAGSLKRIRTRPQEEMAWMFIFSIIIGFTVISLTFDTLKFPNLNWLFHSLLGLMVNSVMINPSKNSHKIPSG